MCLILTHLVVCPVMTRLQQSEQRVFTYSSFMLGIYTNNPNLLELVMWANSYGKTFERKVI